MDFRERSEWYAARQVELDAGGTWEFFNGTVWGHIPYPPCNSSVLKNWRLVPPKPVLKVIDLTPLIESGLDCVFWDKDWPESIGKLMRIVVGVKPYARDRLVEYEHCQPRMSPHVHYWAGGDVCPVPEGFVINVEWRHGIHEGFGEDIVNYQVLNWANIAGICILRVADGYTLGNGVTDNE